ncbi:LysR family transcriptional regulator [Aminivibrio sp.]|jgi:DNA-binding transcriptional LysR family regulator|uniref:LysR family transcriptional regulator n=1 Tax=Aminivibrio sp. TaxID=1872489 RepID=UPI0016B25A40|nr:LysR family transcriptional regulator [Synergistaceae bacterium]
MNLHQLRIFCSIVENGSFRSAADKMFLSQPSISQQIASLEKSYAIRLFNRKGRTISVTPEGKTLYNLAADLIRQADEIPARFKAMQELKTGKLNIGISPFAGNYVLPLALSRFLDEFPSISISLTSGSSNKLISLVKTGTIELAILGRDFSSTNDSELTYRPLFEDPIILTVNYLHPLAGKGKASLSDLRQETLIRLTGHCPLGTYVDEFLLRKRIQFAKEVETEDIDVAKSLVAQGIGVTITSCLSIQREKKSEEIVVVDFEGIQELSWEIQCVYSSSGGLSYPGWEMVKRLEENARKLLK